MKRNLIVVIAVLAVLLSGCKKSSTDENTQPPPQPQPDFTQLKTGNYWVYDFYKVDTNGVETNLNEPDSCYILKDTLVDGNRYFVKLSFGLFHKKSTLAIHIPDTSLVRDSSGYLLMRYMDGTTRILFARDNFSGLLYTDTIAPMLWEEFKMTGKDSVVTVPAGTFTTRSMCMTCFPLEPNYPWGIRKYPNIYGSGIGMIKYYTGFYYSPDHYEARLVRYRVEL